MLKRYLYRGMRLFCLPLLMVWLVFNNDALAISVTAEYGTSVSEYVQLTDSGMIFGQWLIIKKQSPDSKDVDSRERYFLAVSTDKQLIQSMNGSVAASSKITAKLQIIPLNYESDSYDSSRPELVSLAVCTNDGVQGLKPNTKYYVAVVQETEHRWANKNERSYQTRLLSLPLSYMTKEKAPKHEPLKLVITAYKRGMSYGAIKATCTNFDNTRHRNLRIQVAPTLSEMETHGEEIELADFDISPMQYVINATYTFEELIKLRTKSVTVRLVADEVIGDSTNRVYSEPIILKRSESGAFSLETKTVSTCTASLELKIGEGTHDRDGSVAVEVSKSSDFVEGVLYAQQVTNPKMNQASNVMTYVVNKLEPNTTYYYRIVQKGNNYSVDGNISDSASIYYDHQQSFITKKNTDVLPKTLQENKPLLESIRIQLQKQHLTLLDIEGLNSLISSYSDIRTLRGIENCISLKTLYMSNAKFLVNLNGIEACQQLSIIHFSNTPISDISAFLKMQHFNGQLTIKGAKLTSLPDFSVMDKWRAKSYLEDGRNSTTLRVHFEQCGLSLKALKQAKFRVEQGFDKRWYDMTEELNKPREKVTFKSKQLQVRSGKTHQLIISPSSPSNQQEGVNVHFLFLSSNRGVVTVDDFGKITAMKAGYAEVYVMKGDGLILGTVTVKVTK